MGEVQTDKLQNQHLPTGAESLIAPGVNPIAILWIVFLGLPLFLLFLIFSKQGI